MLCEELRCRGAGGVNDVVDGTLGLRESLHRARDHFQAVVLVIGGEHFSCPPLVPHQAENADLRPQAEAVAFQQQASAGEADEARGSGDEHALPL